MKSEIFLRMVYEHKNFTFSRICRIKADKNQLFYS
jgi:hypothetical protein